MDVNDGCKGPYEAKRTPIGNHKEEELNPARQVKLSFKIFLARRIDDQVTESLERV